MLGPNTIANSAAIGLLAACVLGIGFLIRFFIGVADEGSKARVAHPYAPGEGKFAVGTLYQRPRHRVAEVNSGAHLALGVLRITTVLNSDLKRGRRPAAHRVHFVNNHTYQVVGNPGSRLQRTEKRG